MNRLILGVCITVALAGHALADEESAVHADVLAKSTTSWDGNRLPAYPTGAPEISILRIRISPGATLPLHKHPVINAGYIVHGELTVITEENKTLHLKAGDAIVEVVNTWHHGKNEGKEPAEIVVFYAGTPGVSISVKK